MIMICLARGGRDTETQSHRVTDLPNLQAGTQTCLIGRQGHYLLRQRRERYRNTETQRHRDTDLPNRQAGTQTCLLQAGTSQLVDIVDV